MESEIKKNLSDLSQIPQKEFEKHFSEWMARDDVARSLQAKLRMDLIKNFNQTHLGKQILSQTTSTTGYGASTQRLTLSPLILALNTLVAEFLYAQNCHFSLSVFCTEIPFRNTLPDFESSRCFRFTEAEVLDIFEAISSGAKFEKDFKNTICREYAANANSSLLLLVLKNLLTVKQQPTTAIKGTSFESEPPPPPPTKTWDESIQTDLQPSFKATTSDRNFLHLNKYLIVLSRKVKEMTQQFEQLQQRGEPNWPLKTMPRPRNLKCKRQRKYENLNRSLERIVENLNKMAHSKLKSKRVAAILTAIEAMSKQFEKCSSSFEQVSKVLVNQNMVKPKAERILKAEPTQATQTAEKSYIEWVHEMRTTKNGEQFLRKVELSLGKALRKQKQQLDQETEVKLRHQKELLIIRYKQKLLEKWQKFDTRESAVDVRNNNRYESIERQLKQFEARHYDLLDKIRYAEQFGEQQQQSAMRNKMRAKSETTVEPREAAKDNKTEAFKAARNCHSDESLRRGDSYQQKTLQSKNSKDVDSKLQNMKKSVSEGECNVDHIVCDAKMRIRELELESNQLEQSFRNYLERQRLQKEASKRAAETMWNNYALEKNKIENQFQLAKQRMRNQFQGRQRRRRRSLESSNEGEGEDSEECFNRQLRGLNVERLRGTNKKVVAHQSSESSNTIVFKNAIHEAKSKLFHDQTLKLKKSTNYKESVLPEVNSNLSVIYSNPRLPLDNISRRSSEPQLPLAALNLTASEVQLQPQGLKRKTEFNFSSTDSDSDAMQATKQAAAMVFGRSRQLNEMTEQQLGISSATTTTTATTTSTMSTGQSKAKKALNFASAVDVRKGNKRDQHPFDSAKEGQKQQLRKEADSTTTLIKVAESYQQKCEEIETSSKLLPTSLVLQQSMAKMNKLFGEQQELSTRVKALEVKTREQEDNNTATNQSKETTARTTTSVATTLRHRFNEYVGDTAATVASSAVASVASSLHADDDDDAVLSNIGDGVTTLAAARTITTTKQLNMSADKTEKKNFNAIEKNNHPTRTVIETVASLQQAEAEEEKEKEETTRATTRTTTEKEIPLQSNTITENLLEGAIKSKQNMLRSENNNCNEAQVFNVDNQRIGNDNNRNHKKQKEKQKENEEWEERKLHQEKLRKQTFKDQELNFTTSTESSVTDEEQQHQQQQQLQQQHQQLQEAEEQQVVEFGEIIDNLNVDTALAAITTFVDDNAAIVIESSSDSTTASSFELEQKAAKSSSSDFWE